MKQWVFDGDFTRGYTKIRQEFIGRFLERVRLQMRLESAIDVGAGVGYFSRFLRDLGFRVLAVDGREENVAEARRRYADIEFRSQDVEAPVFAEIGRFDLVLCVGLLYHLENPFRAIRNLYAITEKILIVESVCSPGESASMELLDEGHVEDQGLSYVGFYPTEACLVKMLYKAGFAFVYRFRNLPRDPQFADTARRKRSRTLLVAAKVPIGVPELVQAEEPFRLNMSKTDPWTTPWSRISDFWNEKVFALRVVASRTLKTLRKKTDPL